MYLKVALIALAVTWIPTLVGVAFDIYALKAFALSAYVGANWVGPGAFFGIAANREARRRHLARPKRIGLFVGASTAIALLVAASFVIASVTVEE